MSAPARVADLARGDFAVVTFAATTVRAMVVLVSDDARSVAIMFSGVLGGYVNMMPLLWSDARGGYVDLITAGDVVITNERDFGAQN